MPFPKIRQVYSQHAWLPKEIIAVGQWYIGGNLSANVNYMIEINGNMVMNTLYWRRGLVNSVNLLNFISVIALYFCRLASKWYGLSINVIHLVKVLKVISSKRSTAVKWPIYLIHCMVTLWAYSSQNVISCYRNWTGNRFDITILLNKSSIEKCTCSHLY